MTKDPYASLKQGLVGAWIPSISGSGLLLPDLSCRGNNGTLTNMDASDWVSSGTGRALDFDGVDDVVRLPFSIEMPFTVSGWFLSRSTTAIQYALSICNSTSNAPHYSLIFDGNAVGDLIYAAQEGDATAFQGSSFTGYVANQMYHLTGVFRSSTNRQLYVNANAQTVNTTSVGTTTINRLAIGRFDRLNPVVPFDGVADDIRLYNRALTESEIKLLASDRGIGFKPARKLSFFSTRYTYQPPKAKVFEGVRVRDHDYASLRQGLVGAWCPSLANGGSGNLLPDQSGRGNHGTLTNMSAGDWVSGQYGRALEFDGTDTSGGNDTQNRVTLPKDFGVDVIGFSGWINPIALNKRGICASWPNNTAPRFAITLLTNGTLEVYRGQNTQSTAALSTNRWQHIFVFSDGNNTSYYIDGVFSNTANQQGITPGLQTNFLLGNNYWGALEGYLDDVRIYDRHLTLAEIRLLASRPGIGLRQEIHRNTFYQFPSGARRKRILTGLP